MTPEPSALRGVRPGSNPVYEGTAGATTARSSGEVVRLVPNLCGPSRVGAGAGFWPFQPQDSTFSRGSLLSWSQGRFRACGQGSGHLVAL